MKAGETVGDNTEEIRSASGDQTAYAPDQSVAKDDQDMAIPQSSKSPAFQFYPKDFLSSDKVDRMSMTERGVYITLMSKYWLAGDLPSDMGELASMVRMKVQQFERMWTKGQLHLCFVERNGRYVQPRLEAERKKQAEFRRRQTDNGLRGGRPRKGLGLVTPTQPESIGLPNESSSSSSPICNLQSAKKRESAEPRSDSTPAVLSFPTVGSVSSWVLTQGRIDSWLQSYPNVDVTGECRKASAWIEANPERRKTAKGMSAFLVNWLNRAADRGGRRVESAGPQGVTVPSAEETRRRYLVS